MNMREAQRALGREMGYAPFTFKTKVYLSLCLTKYHVTKTYRVLN